MATIGMRVRIGGALAAMFLLLATTPARGQTSTQVLAPAALVFPEVVAGQRSAPQVLTFTSTSTVVVNGVNLTGPFELASGTTCGSGVTVGPGSAGCTVAVVFAPSAAGPQTGTVTVVYNTDVTRQSALSGTATTPQTTTSTPPPTTTAPRPTTSTIRIPTSTSRPTTSVVPTTVVDESTTTTTPATTTTTGPPPPSPAVRGVTLDATAAGRRRSGPPGIGLTVSGSGYPPAGAAAREAAGPVLLAQADAECSTVYFFLDGRRLGSARPDAAGDVRKKGLSVPGDVDPGRYDVTSSCRTSGSPRLATAAFEVTDAGLHRSALATSLPQVDQVDFSANRLIVSLLAVAGLMVLIAFPAELFNTTLEEHYDEVRGWFGLQPRPLGGGRHHGALLVAFLLLGGPLWFLMQPNSRVDAATAIGALGLSLATAVVVVASDIPAAVHVRRRYRERASPIALPGSLVIALACVALSRAVHFQPGYFYGLVGGLALSRSLEREESGRIAAGTAVALLALSIGSWLALLPVSAAAAESGKALGTILAENILGGIFWAALDSLVIAMLPLRLLEGAKIVGWSRAAWVVLYGVTLLAFVHILLRPSTGYVSNTSVSPPGVVIGLFVGFATFSFAFWGYFRFRRPPSGRPRSGGEALPDQV